MILAAGSASAILPAFNGRVVVIDTAVARRCAELHVPDPRLERDALIDASTWIHGLTMVTRNVGDFGAMGVDLINPWEAPAP